MIAAAKRHILTPARLLALQGDELRRKGGQKGTLGINGKQWQIRYKDWITDTDGNLEWKETSKSLGPVSSLSRRAARALADPIVAKANEQSQCVQGFATFEQFVDARFRPEHIAALKSTGTGKAFYESILRKHVLPTLGKVQLKDVDFSTVQRLVSAKSQKYSGQTVKHIRNVISAVLRHAKKLKMFSGDLPTDGILLPRLEPTPRRAMTVEQMNALIAALPPKHRPLMAFLTRTGLRIGEAAGLRWKRVNLTAETVIHDGFMIPPHALIVVDSYIRGQYTTPKSSAGVRVVALASVALEALHAQRTAHPTADDEAPVFPGDRGGPMNSNNFQKRHVKKAAEKIGQPWICSHVARHTFATLLHAAGATNVDRRTVLGHSAESMSDRYTHPDLLRIRALLDAAEGPKLG